MDFIDGPSRAVPEFLPFRDNAKPPDASELRDVLAWTLNPPRDWDLDDIAEGLLAHRRSEEVQRPDGQTEIVERGRCEVLLEAPLETVFALVDDPAERLKWDDIIGPSLQKHESKGFSFVSFKFEAMMGLAAHEFLQWDAQQAFDRKRQECKDVAGLSHWSHVVLWQPASMAVSGLPSHEGCYKAVAFAVGLVRHAPNPERQTKVVVMARVRFSSGLIQYILPRVIRSVLHSQSQKLIQVIGELSTEPQRRKALREKGLQGLSKRARAPVSAQAAEETQAVPSTSTASRGQGPQRLRMPRPDRAKAAVQLQKKPEEAKEEKSGIRRSPDAEDQEKKGPKAQRSAVEAQRTSLQHPPELGAQTVADPTPTSQMDSGFLQAEKSSKASGNPPRLQRRSWQHQPPESSGPIPQSQMDSSLSEDPFLLSSVSTSSKDPAAPPTADAALSAAPHFSQPSLLPQSSDLELPNENPAPLQGEQPQPSHQEHQKPQKSPSEPQKSPQEELQELHGLPTSPGASRRSSLRLPDRPGRSARRRSSAASVASAGGTSPPAEKPEPLQATHPREKQPLTLPSGLDDEAAALKVSLGIGLGLPRAQLLSQRTPPPPRSSELEKGSSSLLLRLNSLREQWRQDAQPPVRAWHSVEDLKAEVAPDEDRLQKLHGTELWLPELLKEADKVAYLPPPWGLRPEDVEKADQLT